MPPSPANTRIVRTPWWLHPGWAFAAIAGTTMAAALWQSDYDYSLYGTAKHLRTSHGAMALVAILIFAMSSLLGLQTGKVRGPGSPLDDATLLLWFRAAAGLTFVGYAIWLLIGVRNGLSLSVIRDFLTLTQRDAADSLKAEVFPTIPGVTTATQFGIVAAILGTWLTLRGVPGVRWPLALIFAITAVRALLLSERLALIELAVPCAVVAFRLIVLGRPAASAVRSLLPAAPLLGLAALVVVFGGAEYFRSWRYYEQEFDSFGRFTVWRVAGYYTTAHNNGAMALETRGQWPLPFSTLRPLWTLPGINQSPLAYEKLTGLNAGDVHTAMLENYGNPELNNEGGLFQPALDFGLMGFFLFWAAYGFVAGRAYRGFLEGTLGGVLFYSLVFLSLLEVPRFLYLFYSRALPALAFLLLLAIAAAWASRRATVPSPALLHSEAG